MKPGRKGEEWKTGGGSVWVTANYDPATNLSFWGTGNGGPWMGDQRPGDNLYIASTVAIDVATGQIKGHMQYNPNESWDWDEVSPPILVDYQRNGRTVKGLINVARNGYLYFLERTAGAINFVDGDAVREAERLQRPRSEDGPARSSIQRRNRAPTRWPISVRPGGAERTGRPWPSIRRHGCSTFPRTRISARRSSAGR